MFVSLFERLSSRHVHTRQGFFMDGLGHSLGVNMFDPHSLKACVTHTGPSFISLTVRMNYWNVLSVKMNRLCVTITLCFNYYPPDLLQHTWLQHRWNMYDHRKSVLYCTWVTKYKSCTVFTVWKDHTENLQSFLHLKQKTSMKQQDFKHSKEKVTAPYNLMIKLIISFESVKIATYS